MVQIDISQDFGIFLSRTCLIEFLLLPRSTMVKRGEKGDASVLKPSIMFCVPLILDRIYKVDP